MRNDYKLFHDEFVPFTASTTLMANITVT